MNRIELVADYDYHLPEELIATAPLAERTSSKMLVLKAGENQPQHKIFSQIIDDIDAGDCLVFNNTKVFPARLVGFKESGGRAEILLSKQMSPTLWEALVSFKGKYKIGKKLRFVSDDGIHELVCTVKERIPEASTFLIEFNEPIQSKLPHIGKVPLPPYFKREALESDTTRYQTVYASPQFDKAVAAPTAGLHFDKDLLDALQKKGVHLVFVTLHVGLGTFMPLRCERIDDHVMHTEEWEIDQNAAETLNSVMERSAKIWAVGTTSVRVLETAFNGKFFPSCGATAIFIRPGYRFKAVDKLITNFHLPQSTLLMLVSAVSGKDRILSAYSEAIRENYRFFSYGDCCCLDVENKNRE